MTDNGSVLPWLVIRQDDNGNRYRVGRYASRGEAEEVAERLAVPDADQLYVVERTDAFRPAQ